MQKEDLRTLAPVTAFRVPAVSQVAPGRPCAAKVNIFDEKTNICFLSRERMELIDSYSFVFSILFS